MGKLSVNVGEYISGNAEPMETRSMFPVNLHMCDICGKPRSKRVHARCSKIRQQKGFEQSTRHIKLHEIDPGHR